MEDFLSCFCVHKNEVKAILCIYGWWKENDTVIKTWQLSTADETPADLMTKY